MTFYLIPELNYLHSSGILIDPIIPLLQPMNRFGV